MKKTIIGALAATVLLTGAIGVSVSANDDDVKISTEQSKQLIGFKKAKEVALKKVKGKVDDIDLETENGKVYYEVEIDTDKKQEFEVKVDAYTAKVLSVKESNDDDDDDNVQSTDNLITEKDAIAIANKGINGKVVSIELDSDDGRYEYEIELLTKEGEYEITIDAATGKILEKDFDSKDDNDDDDDDDN